MTRFTSSPRASARRAATLAAAAALALTGAGAAGVGVGGAESRTDRTLRRRAGAHPRLEVFCAWLQAQAAAQPIPPGPHLA